MYRLLTSKRAREIRHIRLNNNTFFGWMTDQLLERLKYPEDPYWFDEDDSSVDYCWDCIHEVQKQRLESGSDIEDVHIRGGYVWESDSTRCCEKCGKLLNYELTGYGAMEEARHFLAADTDPWDWNNPTHCYEIMMTIYGTDDHWKFEKMSPVSRSRLLRLLRKSINY